MPGANGSPQFGKDGQMARTPSSEAAGGRGAHFLGFPALSREAAWLEGKEVT